MAKLTLLEITQDVLNDLDSDEVNSIDDTTESVQVAAIVRSTYQALMSNRNWPHTRKLIQIVPSGVSTLPTYMTIKDPIKELSFLNYDKARITDGTRRKLEPVKYLDQDDFLRYVNQRDNTASNILTVKDPTTLVQLNIRNDYPPTYFTSFDDNTLVFDSYDSQVDDTLQAHKIQCYAYVMPLWVHTDDAVPDLPEEAFVQLVEEAKSKASMKLRQSADQKAEQESGRQRKWLARKAWRVEGGIQFPNYGRNRSGCPEQPRRDPTFRQDY